MNKEQPPPKPKKNWKLLLICLFAAVLIWGTYNQRMFVGPRPISPSELYQAIDEGRVKHFTVVQFVGDVVGEFTDGTQFQTRVASAQELEQKAIANRVPFEVVEPSSFMRVLLGLLPWLLIGGIIWFIFSRQVNGATTSNARIAAQKPDTRFEDIAGCDSAKEEVMEVVKFLNDPGKYKELGARIPKGVLLVGPPGCGKTMIAKAVANAADAAFIEISGSEFVKVFVGAGAGRVRSLFRTARKFPKCIIFIDEIDAVGGRRFNGFNHGGHQEREQTLNELLAQMGGFNESTGIVVIAATNRPEILDPALLRPGRFDRHVLVGLPDPKGREEILKVHIKKIKRLADDVALDKIAKETPGFSGADLENLINEAAMLAVRKEKDAVCQADLEEAIDIARLGRERRVTRTPEEDRICAYHESGHTLVALKLLGLESVRKVTIVPRGQSGGATFFHNEGEEHLHRKGRLIKHLVVAMGGRVAEMTEFNEETSGACGDFQTATELAKRMICEWGMSEKVGKAVFQQISFLGGGQIEASEEVKKIIDEEVKRFLDEAYQKAVEILTEHRDLLNYLAKELMDKKILPNQELKELIHNFERAQRFKTDPDEYLA